MDLAAARDAIARLGPLSRALADLTLVIDGAVQAQQDQQEALTATEALCRQIEDLRAQLTELRKTQTWVRQAYELERGRYQELIAQQAAAFQAQKAKAEVDLAEFLLKIQAAYAKAEQAVATPLK